MKRMMMTALAWATVSLAALAQITVFGGNYRIPSILRLTDGKVVAFSDYRPEGGDVGQRATLQNDIVAKVFDKRWGEEMTLLKAGKHDNGRLFSFGDAATAYDAQTGRILLMCAYGDVCYWNSTLRDPIGVYRAYFHLDGNTIVKDSAQEVTREIYPLFHGAVMKTFFTSGRICQSSRPLRPMCPQRLYASLASNLGAMVVFSDDFGQTWDILGGMSVQPAPQGDEAKLVELPNGDVLLNCRARDADGRYLNIFHYTNPSRAEGAWEQPVLSADTTTLGLYGARCNGETLVLPVRSVRTGKRTHLILQSLPFGTDRSRVGIYYKACGEGVQQVSELATGWRRFDVSKTHSAYSTMAFNGRDGIALLYEEDLNGPNPDNFNYNIKYVDLPIAQITYGEYLYDNTRK